MSSWLVVTLKVQDGKQAEFESFVTDLVQQVRANEPGTLVYTLTKSKTDPTEYTFIEQYATPEDRVKHGQSEYFKAAGPKFAAVLAGRPTMVELDPIV